MALLTGSTIVFGLLNYENKYLTAEKFGNQINVTGTSMRSNQTWTFEKVSESTQGYFKSNQGKYLQTDKNGVVTCTQTERKEEFLFDVEIAVDGQWTIKDPFGKYLSGNSERLFTTFKIEKESVWSIHLTLHPQCNMKSIARKRYVYLYKKQLHANEDLPWGKSAIITLKFMNGRYAIQDCSGQYLNGVTGEMVSQCNEDQCLYNLFIQSQGVAFRCRNEKYLTVHGPQGKLIASKGSISKDELFCVEESRVQVILTANNGKMVSTKQSIDVSASQSMQVAPIEDTEIFQLEYLSEKCNNITLLTKSNKYWEATDKSVTASKSTITDNCIFKIEIYNGKIALKASNGKYIVSTSGGALAPTSDVINDNTLFLLTIANKTKVMLQCLHGYVGATTNGKKVQCNLGNAEELTLLEDGGKYQVKTANNLFFKVDSDLSITTADGTGDYFAIELHGINKLKIKGPNGLYLIGNQNGCLISEGEEGNKNALWKF